jgi:hypothetical protein
VVPTGSSFSLSRKNLYKSFVMAMLFILIGTAGLLLWWLVSDHWLQWPIVESIQAKNPNQSILQSKKSLSLTLVVGLRMMLRGSRGFLGLCLCTLVLFCAGWYHADVSISVSRKTEKCSVSSSSEFPEAWICTPPQTFNHWKLYRWWGSTLDCLTILSSIVWQGESLVVAELFPSMISCM